MIASRSTAGRPLSRSIVSTVSEVEAREGAGLADVAARHERRAERALELPVTSWTTAAGPRRAAADDAGADAVRGVRGAVAAARRAPHATTTRAVSPVIRASTYVAVDALGRDARLIAAGSLTSTSVSSVVGSPPAYGTGAIGDAWRGSEAGVTARRTCEHEQRGRRAAAAAGRALVELERPSSLGVSAPRVDGAQVAVAIAKILLPSVLTTSGSSTPCSWMLVVEKSARRRRRRRRRGHRRDRSLGVRHRALRRPERHRGALDRARRNAVRDARTDGVAAPVGDQALNTTQRPSAGRAWRGRGACAWRRRRAPRRRSRPARAGPRRRGGDAWARR